MEKAFSKNSSGQAAQGASETCHAERMFESALGSSRSTCIGTTQHGLERFEKANLIERACRPFFMVGSSTKRALGIYGQYE